MENLNEMLMAKLTRHGVVVTDEMMADLSAYIFRLMNQASAFGLDESEADEVVRVVNRAELGL